MDDRDEMDRFIRLAATYSVSGTEFHPLACASQSQAGAFANKPDQWIDRYRQAPIDFLKAAFILGVTFQVLTALDHILGCRACLTGHLSNCRGSQGVPHGHVQCPAEHRPGVRADASEPGYLPVTGLQGIPPDGAVYEYCDSDTAGNL